MCSLERKWGIFLACFYGICCSCGFHPSISVLYIDFLDEFHGTKSETSLVQSVCSAVIFCTGIISGSLSKKFDVQKNCMMVGTFLSSSGLVLSYFADGITFLVKTIGIISGFGFSMCYVSCYSVVPQFFSDKRRFIVLAILSLGSGVGGSIFPILLQYLIKIYKWRGTMLIFAGINLNMLVCALIMNPTSHQEISRKISCKSDTTATDIQACKTSTKSEDPLRIMLIDVITNKTYQGYAVSAWIIFPCFNSVIVFFVDFLKFKGIPKENGVWLLTCMNIANVSFRLIPGFLAQIPQIPKLSILAFFAIVSSINFALFPFVSSLSHYVILIIIFGICLGGMTFLFVAHSIWHCRRQIFFFSNGNSDDRMRNSHCSPVNIAQNGT